MDLRLARRKAGLTQRDCAQLLAVPQSRISSFEKGQLLPSIPQLMKLSIVLNRQFEDLYKHLTSQARITIKRQLPSLPERVRNTASTFNRTSSIRRLQLRLTQKPDEHEGA